MSDISIIAEGLSKRYRIGLKEESRDTLGGAIAGLFLKPVRNLRRIQQLSRFGEKGQEPEDVIWALDDVSFKVRQGEVVGIIGRNGSGKTTLLRILSKITKPTRGRAEFRGRVSSLLAVGTGFHPELTGRDNVYLNGTVLGMRSAEIDRKFDEIVEFSGVEKFIDTPVKRYSSGMKVRLGFSVAAHLEPEILLIDEVLAVGDVEFQNKCLGKMEDVVQKGRTVLFVSHNMAAIQHLCPRTILLRDGKLVVDSDTATAISTYMRMDASFSGDGLAYSVNRELLENPQHPDIQITDIQLLNASGELLRFFGTGEPLTVRIYYKAKREFPSQAFVVSMKNSFGQEIFRLSTNPISGFQIKHLKKRGYIDLFIESLPITSGRYYFDAGFRLEGREWITKVESVIELEISPKDVYGSGMALDNRRGMIVLPHHWEHYTID